MAEPPARIRAALHRAEGRMLMLQALASLRLPDALIAAGAVRNAVWEALHGFSRSTPLNDVDVIWFDPRQDAAADRALERLLQQRCPKILWSVKNQARMHLRNGDPPYAGSLDAMRYWPETATGVAARLSAGGAIQLHAAFGFDDLIGPKLPPTPRESARQSAVFHQRIAAKFWLTTWPRLEIVTHLTPGDGVTP